MEFVLLVVGAVWLTPILIAFWIGRATAPSASSQATSRHRCFDALLELDRLRKERRISAASYKAVRSEWDRDCRDLGVYVPPMLAAEDPTVDAPVGDFAATDKATTSKTNETYAVNDTTAPQLSHSADITFIAPASKQPPIRRQDSDAAPLFAEVLDAGLDAGLDAPPTLPPSEPEVEVQLRAPTAPMSNVAAPTPTNAPAPWDIPDEPVTPRRTWGELLHSFMEEKNIRWGELLSGMLIVGSAAGLVLSLRDQLQQTIPYFPSLMFLLLIGSVHAAGSYTYRKWKLETTSRGVLIIGMLLVPVGLMAACLLSAKGEVRAVTDPLYLLAVVLGIGGYGTMCWFSSRVLLPAHALALSTSVLGASASTLAIHRMAGGDHGLLTQLWLGLIPVAFATAAPLAFAQKNRQRWNTLESERYSLAVALPGLAAAIAVSYLAYLVGRPGVAAGGGILASSRVIAPTLGALFAALAVGGLAWQRRSDDVRWQVTGSALTLAGLALACVALIVSWPIPYLILATGLIASFILMAGGLASQSPTLVAGSLVALTPAWLVGTHLMLGNLEAAERLSTQPSSVLISATSALSLSVMMLATVAAAIGQRTWGRGSNSANSANDEEGRQRALRVSQTFFAGSGAIALGSVLLALTASVQSQAMFDVQVASGLLATYGVGALLASGLIADSKISLGLIAGGALMVLAACLNATLGSTPMVAWSWIQRPAAVGLLWFTSLMGAVALIHFVWRPRRDNLPMAGVIADYALGGSIAAIVIAYFPHALTLPAQALLWWSGAAVCFGAAALRHFERVRSEDTIHEGQNTVDLAGRYLGMEWLSFIAVGVTAAAIVHSQAESAMHFLDGNMFHWIAVSVAVWCIGLSAVHGLTRPQWLASMARQSAVNMMAGVLFVGTFGHMLLAAIPVWRSELFDMAITWPPAQHSLGLGAIAVAVTGLFIGQRIRRQPARIGFVALGLLSVALLVRLSLLTAAPALTARWLVAAWALATAGLVWRRASINTLWQRVGAASVTGIRDLAQSMSVAVLAPAATLTLSLAVVGLGGADRWLGPDDAGLSHPIAILRYAGPIGCVAIACLLHAAVLSVSPLAVAGGLLVLAGASMSVLSVSLVDGFNHVDIAQLVQWNLVVGAIWAWAWAGVEPQLLRSAGALSESTESNNARPERHAWRGWLILISMLPLGIAIRLLAAIVVEPQGSTELASLLSRWPSWLGVALLGSVAILGSRNHREKVSGLLWGGLGITVCALACGNLDAVDVQRQWWAYHGLLTGISTLAVLMTVGVCVVSSRRLAASEFHFANHISTRSLAQAVLAMVAIAYALCWRALPSDPNGDTWSLWTCITLGVVVGTLAFRTKFHGLPAGNALLFGTAAWCGSLHMTPIEHQWLTPWLTVLLTSIGWGVISLLALRATSLRLQSRGDDRESEVTGPPANRPDSSPTLLANIARWTAPSDLPQSRFAWQMACVGSAITLLIAIWHMLKLGEAASFDSVAWHLGVVVVAQAMLCMVCLWDPKVSRRAGPIFVTGFAGLFALMPLLSREDRVSALGVGAAGLLALAAAIWHQREAWCRLLRQWGSPEEIVPADGQRQPTASWLIPTVVGGSLTLTLVATAGVLFAEQRWERFAMAGIALLGSLAIGRLATPVWKARSEDTALPAATLRLHHLSLALGVVACVWASWADISLSHSSILLERLVRAVSMISVSALVLGAVTPRWVRPQGAWSDACRNVFLGCVVGAAGLFVGLLGVELQWFDPVAGAPLSSLQIGSVLVFMSGLVVALIAVAVLPERDPLKLSDEARVAYTYAAQALAGLLVLHVYLCMPWMFTRWSGYWPYVTMGIAFAGAGAGEVLQRSGIKVLGGPIVRTSLLLPLAPLIGMFIAHTEGSYTAVMASSALLFAMAAFTGKSWLCGAAAVVLGNLTLWSFYRESNWASFAENPQVWLIPPAVSVLVAAQFYRDKLKPEQLSFLRYINIALIYISSTSELFIHGLGESLWPPIILASLSVLGVLAGIGMRIRAFLYFGSAFLLMSMVAMVSHAGRAIGHVWPWWAFGITLGIVILVMFGMFEKRRDEMRGWFDELKQWDA